MDAGNFASPQSIATLGTLLDSQIARLREFESIALTSTSEPWQSLLGYPLAIRDSLESFRLLAIHNRLRDSYVVARTAFETSVTYAYIVAKGPEAAERAARHAHQKAYRDLERETRVGHLVVQLRHSGKRPVTDLPQELQDAFAEFTSKRGDEIRDWTPDNLIAQLKVIAQAFGDDVATAFLFPQFAIFRHSSEIAHGSLFGTLWPLGMLDPNGPPKSKEDFEARLMGQLVMLHLMLAMCADAVLRVGATGFPIVHLTSGSKEAIRQVRELPWAKGAV